MGGFGVVFAVHDPHASADVALEWLRNSDASTIARFKRELRSLADIVHPNLVGFRELIMVAGEWFFTMDLVSGVELLNWVRPASPDETNLALRSTALSGARGLGSTVLGPPPPLSAPKSNDPEPIDGQRRPLCLADLRHLRSTLGQLAAGPRHRSRQRWHREDDHRQRGRYPGTCPTNRRWGITSGLLRAYLEKILEESGATSPPRRALPAST